MPSISFRRHRSPSEVRRTISSPEVYAGAVPPNVQPPPAEAAIDIALVRALLEEQRPDLAGLPLVGAGEGSDNRTFRSARVWRFASGTSSRTRAKPPSLRDSLAS